MAAMNSFGTTVTVTFSANEHAALTEQAAQRGIPIDGYIRQTAAQRAHDGELKNALLQGAGRRPAVTPSCPPPASTRNNEVPRKENWPCQETRRPMSASPPVPWRP